MSDGKIIVMEADMFGEVELPEDGTLLVDGGTHGRVGHSLWVTTDGRVRWERRLDSLGDQTQCKGEGTRILTEDELAEFGALADRIWGLAITEPEEEEDPSVPRYCWMVAMRRGDDAGMLEGPPFGHPYLAPPAEVAAALDWMFEKVLAWCSEATGRE
ncbi:MAG: hypothetical protein EG823_07280 [Actinobacteria bacterium]|nr:hypothetical protein [Actinomycetota bacterium]